MRGLQHRVGSVGLLLAAVGCSGAVPYAPPDWTRVPRTSGLDPALRVVDLDDEQREALCDWNADLFGVGKVYDCGGDGERSVQIEISGDGCLEARRPPACPLTVGEVERCAISMSRDLCDPSLRTRPECSSEAQATCRLLPK